MTEVATSQASLDAKRVLSEFPIFERRRQQGPFYYLDSAATAQKPREVLQALLESYSAQWGPIARGVYRLSAEATKAYEEARARAARFLGASSPDEVVFVRGTTEAMNLLAAVLEEWVHAGDEVLVTRLDHHSNFVPWQRLVARRGARLRIAEINENGEVPLSEFERCIGSRTRIVALPHVSNVIGCVLPVGEIARLARGVGALVVVDGAQGAPHLDFRVPELRCDAYAFSGHKTYGPSGIGVLWIRSELARRLPPYQTGGGMIQTVGDEISDFLPPPHRFEAGSPAAAEAVALGIALEWMEALGRSSLQQHATELATLAVEALQEIPRVVVVGQPTLRVGVVSFVVRGIHAHDVGTVLDSEGVCVRAGHHCAQPLMRRLGLPATVRASFGAYNTEEDLEALVRGVRRACELFPVGA
jgi:cysteine desulfurase/selenocysteine lyase